MLKTKLIAGLCLSAATLITSSAFATATPTVGHQSIVCPPVTGTPSKSNPPVKYDCCQKPTDQTSTGWYQNISITGQKKGSTHLYGCAQGTNSVNGSCDINSSPFYNSNLSLISPSPTGCTESAANHTTPGA